MVLSKTAFFTKIGFVVFAIALSCGCQAPKSVTDFSMKPFSNAEPEVEYGQPLRMAVIWKESSISAPGKNAVRGFGGRVYFYDEENETVRVDGELSVFAFDDTSDHKVKARQPDRKYVFRSSELQGHYGQTGLGHSYNIWIPWDEVGGERKTISLVPIFKPVDGMIPKSDQSIAILSGTTSEKEDGFLRTAGVNSKVRQVSTTVPAGELHRASPLGVSTDEQVSSQEDDESAEATIRTTTFDVPRATASRMNISGHSPVRRSMAKDSNGVRAANFESNPVAGQAAQLQPAEAGTQGSLSTANAKRRQRPQSARRANAQDAVLKKPTVFGKPGGFR